MLEMFSMYFCSDSVAHEEDEKKMTSCFYVVLKSRNHYSLKLCGSSVLGVKCLMKYSTVENVTSDKNYHFLSELWNRHSRTYYLRVHMITLMLMVNKIQGENNVSLCSG
jgi:hypothetical protein